MDQRETAWRREAHDRYDNYAMLARLFQREVDAELLADLKESFAAEPTGDHRFDEGCALLRQHLDGVEDVARGRSALAIDYCLTFLGYGTDPDAADEAGLRAAYPYESIYRSGGKTLGGDRCAQVSQAYRAGEFAPDTERIIAQDHLACELSFHAPSGGARDGRLGQERRGRRPSPARAAGDVSRGPPGAVGRVVREGGRAVFRNRLLSGTCPHDVRMGGDGRGLAGTGAASCAVRPRGDGAAD